MTKGFLFCRIVGSEPIVCQTIRSEASHASANFLIQKGNFMSLFKRRFALAVLAAGLLSTPLAVQADEGRVVMQKSGTVECDGEDIGVMARDAKLKFVGHCPVINFLSGNITATVESADVVILGGNNGNITLESDVNKLTLVGARGSKVAAKNIGSLGLLGSGSEISANKIDHIVLHGADNRIRWQEGEPRIDRQKDENNELIAP